MSPEEYKAIRESSMPFGWESCWDPQGGMNCSRCGGASSMPFGWESCWDPPQTVKLAPAETQVINAFRLGVLLGRGNQIQLFLAGWHVINAFRLGVLLGRRRRP